MHLHLKTGGNTDIYRNKTDLLRKLEFSTVTGYKYACRKLADVVATFFTKVGDVNEFGANRNDELRIVIHSLVLCLYAVGALKSKLHLYSPPHPM